MAGGLAKAGFVPFVTTYATFVTGRAWDQIRTSICYAGLGVKFGGAHAGISVGPDGATHQELEDIAITRILPGMTVVVPADAIECEKATIAAVEVDGPGFPVVTVKEAQMYGGLGGAVAEALMQRRPVPVRIIGVPDTFGKSGRPRELLDHFGLNAANIAAKVRELLL